MEDSFQARVDKVFGSLVSTPSSSPLSALWSLTDQEIAKKEWNGDKHDDDDDDDPDPDQGFFDKPSQGQIRNTKFTVFGELQDHEGPDPDGFNNISDENKRRKKHNPHSTDDEDFDIRSSIGLDCTLDFEEEEDVYDKVAIGKENSVGDRLYMRDIVGMDDNPHHELPSSFNNVGRDNRANHVAAKLRLKEDAETAGNFDSLKLSDVAAAAADRIDNKRVTPKPILKKKKRERMEQGGKSPNKRVRFQEEFNVTHKDPGEQSAAGGTTTTSQEGEDKLHPAEVKAQGSGLHEDSTLMDDGIVEASTSYYSIPDYLRNPSRYTRYTLDSSDDDDDMDEESNRRACMDFLNQLKKPNSIDHSESLVVVSSPKTLIFTPKKKESETSIIVGKDKKNVADNISKDKKLLAFAAGDLDSGICPMEEDKQQQPDILVDRSSCALKPGRQYRSRTIVNCKDE